MFDLRQYVPVFDFDEYKSRQKKSSQSSSDLDIVNLISSNSLIACSGIGKLKNYGLDNDGVEIYKADLSIL